MSERLPFTHCCPCLLLALSLFAFHPCLAEWAKTITCPAGRIYQDIRKDAGREEFCERALPGFLTVKDGPYRFWYSEGHSGANGNYKDGRQIGRWIECDRFDHCEEKEYEAIFPEERQHRNFKPQIPVTYSNGKYVFDFASCRSTWITQTSGPEPISLNILGGGYYRCEVAYLPESTIEHGAPGDYFCRVPFIVGVQKFESINLMQEFTRSGLPQFCHPTYRNGEPLLIQDKKAFVVATTVDVECLGLQQNKGPRNMLTLRLNKYATDLVKQAARQRGPLTTYVCADFGRIEGPEFVNDMSGNTALRYTLSANFQKAKLLRQCIRANFASIAICH